MKKPFKQFHHIQAICQPFVASLRISIRALQHSCLIVCVLFSNSTFAQTGMERKMPAYNKEQLRIKSTIPREPYTERTNGLRSRPQPRTIIETPPVINAPVAVAPAPQINPEIESYSAPQPYNASNGVIDENIFRMQPVPESAFSAPPQQPMTAPQPLIAPQETIAVSQAPEIKEARDAPEVKFFDATATGTAPSYDASAQQAAAVSAPAALPMLDNKKELTRESENILEKLPTDIFPYKPEDAIKGFDIEREDAQRGLGADVNFDSAQPVEAGIKIQQQDMDVNYELEKAYNALLKSNTEIAVHIYNNILNTYPENRHALFGLATTYHKLGFLDKARPLYGKILSSNPYDKEALNNFLALVGEEAPDSAIAYLEQLKLSNNDFSPIYAQLAALYNKEGEVDKAVLNMQQAVALSPNNMVYMYNLAVIYDTNRDYRRAEALYRQIIKAGLKGEEIPVSVEEIQERLTYLASN